MASDTTIDGERPGGPVLRIVRPDPGDEFSSAEGTGVGIPPQPDAQLLAEAAALRGQALRLCECAADADDLVQETFERALRNRDRFDGAHCRAWMGTIMRNLFIDKCRAAAGRPAIVSVDEARTADSPPDVSPAWAEITVADLHDAVAELPERFRAVYELRSFAGLDYRAIADRLGISVNTVSSRLRRARIRLKELLLNGR